MNPQLIDGKIQVDEVADGDVVFFRRPGLLQSLCDRAGEPWRHAAVAITAGRTVLVAEVAGASFRLRALTDAVAASDEVAVARVGATNPELARAVAGWCTEHAGRQQTFAWEDMILAGFIATSRRYALPDDHDVLERGVLAAIDVLRSRTAPEGAVPYTCSSFVAAAFAECGYPIAFDPTAPAALDRRPSLFELVRGGSRPLRGGHDTHLTPRQLATSVRALVTGVVTASGAERTTRDGDDERDLMRWITPGDIWRSRSFPERYEVVDYSMKRRVPPPAHKAQVLI